MIYLSFRPLLPSIFVCLSIYMYRSVTYLLLVMVVYQQLLCSSSSSTTSFVLSFCSSRNWSAFLLRLFDAIFMSDSVAAVAGSSFNEELMLLPCQRRQQNRRPHRQQHKQLLVLFAHCEAKAPKGKLYFLLISSYTLPYLSMVGRPTYRNYHISKLSSL